MMPAWLAYEATPDGGYYLVGIISHWALFGFVNLTLILYDILCRLSRGLSINNSYTRYKKN